MNTPQDDEDLREAHHTLQSMLIPGESILALAVQRRLFALSHRRVIVAATSGRLLGISRGLVGGFTPVDLRWQDLKSVQVKAGVFGSDLSVSGAMQADLATDSRIVTLLFDGLRKDEAQAVYRICQTQEQAWREKRRLRELEELRAQSGGFQPAMDLRPSAQADSAGEADPMERLQRAKTLLERGLISDSEYETVKARIVGQI
ncbi:PH domain-containing protein [Paraburkholderia tropica]|uniref:PH domain-containing protein n=1 Tax=Paraburkholderia tropica TaxID=92647 RepID=UPI003D2CB51D